MCRGVKVTPCAELHLLSALTGLESLNLSETAIASWDLPSLGVMPAVKHLGLRGVPLRMGREGDDILRIFPNLTSADASMCV